MLVFDRTRKTVFVQFFCTELPAFIFRFGHILLWLGFNRLGATKSQQHIAQALGINGLGKRIHHTGVNVALAVFFGRTRLIDNIAV